MTAGFLDYLVPAAELMSAARERAASMSKLGRDSYIATKGRTRENAAKAVRAAVATDIEDWKAHVA